MAEEKSSKIREYLQTKRGKVVVIVFAVILLLFIAAMVTLLLILWRQMPPEPERPKSKTTQTKSTEKTETEKTAEKSKEEPAPKEEAVAPEPAPEEFEPYGYKDPFVPLIDLGSGIVGSGGGSGGSAATATSTTSSTSSTTTTTTSTNGTVNTLSLSMSLLDIFADNGARTAALKYGDALYRVQEGERVDDSAYKVLSIGADSVTLLYGDDRVVLKIGEQITRY